MEAAKPTADQLDQGPQFTGEVEPDPMAWEEIDTGRFMLRRIRGSFRGRALG